MKKFLFAATLLFSAFAVTAQNLKADDIIKLNTERYDFGKIKQGVPVTTYFELTNKGDKPVILESVTASCGCTTPEYTKEPIMAGGSTKIKVGYNAAAPARFEKDVYIKIAGISEMKIVKISGDVIDASTASTTIVNKNNVTINNSAGKPVTKASATSKKTAAAKKAKPTPKTMK